MSLYVIKVRRFYGSREATSVLCSPRSKEEAQALLKAKYADPYQSDQFYLEKWDPNYE